MSDELTEPIYFYTVKGEYGCFSNFSRHPVKYKGQTYKTSEHAFQSEKFLDVKYKKKIKDAASPSEAAKIGRDRTLPLRKDWESVKIDIMRKVVFEKFSQNEDLKTILLGTGDRKLVECTESDQFWAWSKNRGGQNWLGKILMETREKLKQS